VDPQQFFKQQFGGDKFVGIIGEISLARDFSEAMVQSDSMTTEQRLEQRKKRVDDLVLCLINKLSLYTDAFPLCNQDVQPLGTTMEHMASEALNSFRIVAQVEVDSLKHESYGIELLHAIGYTYVLKSEQWISIMDSIGASMYTRVWGLGFRFASGLREKAHIVTETVGTVKTAFDLQTKFTKLQEIKDKKQFQNEHGQAVQLEYTPEEQELQMKLEQEAAEKGMEALWRGSKLEVESVLRQVCDETLGNEDVDIEIRKRRATALYVLGKVYENAKQ
jgi:hypothetical protein